MGIRPGRMTHLFLAEKEFDDLDGKSDDGPDAHGDASYCHYRHPDGGQQEKDCDYQVHCLVNLTVQLVGNRSAVSFVREKREQLR